MEPPFISEIRLMSFSFAPSGWALCNGQLLPINQHQMLFSLLGIAFGGDGAVNFCLPDLRGRVPIHRSATFARGQRGGNQNHTLTSNQLAAHTHLVTASADAANTPLAANAYLAQTITDIYGLATNLTPMLNNTNSVGGGQSHTNMQPYLTLSFCIAIEGVYPT